MQHPFLDHPLRENRSHALAVLACALFAGPAMAAAGPADHARADRECASLANADLAFNASIRVSGYIDASEAKPWTSPDGFRDATTVRQPFCRVAGTLSPVPGSEIKFEVWLPAKTAWNGRFYGTASGGSLGSIQYAALTAPLARGFAAMAHDNGHVSANTYEQSWAFDSATGEVRKDKVIDFASRAQHVATVAAKQLTAAFYGEKPGHAYYVGCSQGGHHGMMEAQRYPGDYDGIVAGAHGGDWSGMMASEAWAAYQVFRNQRSGALSRDMLVKVSNRAIASCDALDGLVDGQIEDPRQCRFDPAVMQCGTGDAAADSCLTPAQVAAVKSIYQGPRKPGTQEQLAPGFVPGSEQFWPWDDQLDLVSGSYYDFYRLILHRNPAWDFLSFDWNRDIDEGRAEWGAIYDAVDPDLGGFRRAGGKLILYHGWSDPLITPFLSVNAWEAMERRMGAGEVATFARLFMIPGMSHCSAGPIGGTRDTQDAAWLTAIQRWVEEGIAPDASGPRDTVIGRGDIDGKTRSRPYCPYPKVARYNGRGDIDAAASFSCKMP